MNRIGSFVRSLLASFALVWLAGCALNKQSVVVQSSPHAESAVASATTTQTGVCHDIIFVADGAGDFRKASQNLKQAVSEAGTPIHVETFVWSHGYKRVLLDQADKPHARECGKELACAVLQHKQAHPESRVYLLGHSAGSAVVLSAAENLPASSVERLILLNPSCRADYDLRCALRAVRLTLDVHCSEKDSYLCYLVRSLCTLKFCFCPCAGVKGFKTKQSDCCSAEQFAKLQHHRWDPSMKELGHEGGHFGAYMPAYLKKYLLPTLCPASSSAAPPANPGLASPTEFVK